MGSGNRAGVISQDKAMLRMPRNPATPWLDPSSTRVRACYGFPRLRWPLFVTLSSAISAVAGPRVGVGLNVLKSAPRGLYRAVVDAPGSGRARDDLSASRAPGLRPRAGYPGPGDCPPRNAAGSQDDRCLAGDLVIRSGETLSVPASAC
jgi:hypothetical protein